MPGEVRIALVGAGRMGRTHLRALTHTPGVAVTAVVEPVEAIRAALAAQGYRTCASVGELPGGAELDGVLVAAPSDRHLELLRALAGRGLPILCEKPVGVRIADVIAAGELDLALQVGYWRRFVPELQALRERIRSGALGEILQVSCAQWDGEPPAAAFRARSGGIAVDMGVHEFDQARWLTGEDISWVLAAPTGHGRDPDAAAILAGLGDGTAATISLGRRFPHGDCCWVEVFGSAGYERIPFLWGAAGESAFEAALVAQASAFAAWVRGAPPQGAGLADALAALTAAQAAGDSLLDGEPRQLRVASLR